MDIGYIGGGVNRVGWRVEYEEWEKEVLRKLLVLWLLCLWLVELYVYCECGYFIV